jgi:hypothetical protein
MNTVMLAGVDPDSDGFNSICLSVLGREIGSEFYSFCQKDIPIMAADIIQNEAGAIKQLKKQNKKYRGDKLKLTIDSIVDVYGGILASEKQVNEKQMVRVAQCIPQDQAFNLIIACIGSEMGKRNVTKDQSGYVKKILEFRERNPEVEEIFKEYNESEAL